MAQVEAEESQMDGSRSEQRNAPKSEQRDATRSQTDASRNEHVSNGAPKAVLRPVTMEDDGVHAQLEDVGQETYNKVKTWWNYWGCYLFTYFVIPVVLVGTFFGASASQEVIAVRNVTAALPNQCDDVFVFSDPPRSYKVWLSIVPMILVIWGILLMNKSSQVVAPATMITTAVLCILYFSEEGLSANLDTVQTAGLVLLTVVDRVLWTVFEYAYNVFTAFMFLRVIQLWGIVAVMRKEFEVLAYCVERKILLIMFNFAILVAVVAPGGSNFLIAGTILLEMNLMDLPEGPEKDKYDLRIGAMCLFGNAVTSAFNLVGVCIIALAGDVIGIVDENDANYPCARADEKCAQKQIGFHFSAQIFILCVATPFIFIWLYTRNLTSSHFLRRDFVLTLGCGLTFALAQVLTAFYIGPELPCLTAAGASSLFYVGYVLYFEPWYDAKRDRRLSVMDFSDDAEVAAQLRAEHRVKPASERYSWILPFIMLTFLLMLTNLFPAVVSAFQGGDDPIAQQAMRVYLLSTITSCSSFVIRWPWFIHPGTMVMYCALATPFLVRFVSSEESQKLLELVDLNAGGMMSGSTAPLGEEVESPGEARLQRSKSLNRGAMRDLIQLSNEKQYSFWTKYRIVMKRAVIDGLGEALPVTVAIASFASLARIMSGFGMTKILSSSLVAMTASAPASFGLVGAILGAIGAGLTGSTTTSNFLFGRLQVQTALDLGLVRGGVDRFGNIWSVCGLQVLGSSAGEAVAPQNAIFSVIILRRRFSDAAVIRGVLPITFFSWLFMCMLIGLVAVGLAQPLY